MITSTLALLLVGSVLAEEPPPLPVPPPLPTEQAAPAGPSQAHLVLNAGVVAGGLVLAGAGAYNLTQARAAYRDYLDEPNEREATSLLEGQVRPRQVTGSLELGLGAVALGFGAVLWAGTDLQVAAGPGRIGVVGRF